MARIPKPHNDWDLSRPMANEQEVLAQWEVNGKSHISWDGKANDDWRFFGCVPFVPGYGYGGGERLIRQGLDGV